jgi:N-acetylglucosamine-6-phosphate deacetylase
MKYLFCGQLVLPDRVVPGRVRVESDRITSVEPSGERDSPAGDAVRVDAGEGYIVPGYVDLHVHGGAGADFMDGTVEAFQTVLEAHARHGTTSLCPTTTVARHDQLLRVLELARAFQRGAHPNPCGARVLGAHFYGPYFHRDARGCHPAANLRAPHPREYEAYLEYAEAICRATVAPELPGAEEFVRACQRRGIGTNVGHSQATFEQMAQAVAWGVQHVDHLYCAMSDKTKLRQQQAYPMRGGVLEAALYFDELTTELICDGKHLAPELLLLALKCKGPDRLALVTDCNRALDMPEGRYLFGPSDGGEPFEHRDGVGLMPDGTGLASSTQGMDHMVRTFVQQTGRPLYEAVRMATLTPARIAGCDSELGSLEAGKRADLLVLDSSLHVQRVFIGGREVARRPAA